MTNYECETMTSVSTQEEADTLMIHHAVEVASNGMNVHIIIFTKHGCAAFGATKDTTSWRPLCIYGHKRKTTQSLPTAYMTSLACRNQEL